MKSVNDIKKIAVLGAGVMGPGIAQTFAMAEYPVTMWTRSEQTREKAKVTLYRNLQTFIEEGLLGADRQEETFNRVNFAMTVEEAVNGADFITETIVENKAAKIELYKTIDAVASDNAIIASNTSALDIFALIPENRLKQAVIAHWYSPPQIIPLVDVVKSEQASQEYADITVALLEKCGKKAVSMKKFIPGYIVNRIQDIIRKEIFNLLDNGYCTPQDIDMAVKSSLMPRGVVLGLCKRMDFAGLDMAANHYYNDNIDLPKTLK